MPRSTISPDLRGAAGQRVPRGGGVQRRRRQGDARHWPAAGGCADSLTDQVFFQLAEQRYLKRETRDYVPKLIAAALIAKEPVATALPTSCSTPLVFDEVLVPDATGLDVIARLADTTVASVLELNPHFVRGVTPPGRVRHGARATGPGRHGRGAVRRRCRSPSG